MNKFTPGPWHIDHDSRRNMEWNNHIVAPNGHAICFMAHSDGKEPERDYANARLIAAAPDLLEALKRAQTLLSELNYSDWIKKTDPASVDIRQRINAAHVIASSAIHRATGAS